MPGKDYNQEAHDLHARFLQLTSALYPLRPVLYLHDGKWVEVTIKAPPPEYYGQGVIVVRPEGFEGHEGDDPTSIFVSFFLHSLDDLEGMFNLNPPRSPEETV